MLAVDPSVSSKARKNADIDSLGMGKTTSVAGIQFWLMLVSSPGHPIVDSRTSNQGNAAENNRI